LFSLINSLLLLQYLAVPLTMAHEKKPSWSGLWKSSASKSSQSGTIQPEDVYSSETSSQESVNRITSANQRRYAKYLAGSLNIDSAAIQPAG